MTDIRQAQPAGDAAHPFRFGLVVSRTNDDVTAALAAAATEAFRLHGAADDAVERVDVPGAFELPMAAARLIDDRDVDAVVCIGALIRGETPHFEVLAAAVAHGIQEVALDSGLPVTFGVLTCDTHEQALARAGGEKGNKGAEAALAAIEMASAYAALAGD